MTEFREIYKMRLIEARKVSNAKRGWMATVDGRRASPSRLMTSTFASSTQALLGARGMVDEQIGYLSQMRLNDPRSAVEGARLSVMEAEQKISESIRTSARTKKKEDVRAAEDRQILLERTRHDLRLAEQSLAKLKISIS